MLNSDIKIIILSFLFIFLSKESNGQRGGIEFNGENLHEWVFDQFYIHPPVYWQNAYSRGKKYDEMSSFEKDSVYGINIGIGKYFAIADTSIFKKHYMSDHWIDPYTLYDFKNVVILRLSDTRGLPSNFDFSKFPHVREIEIKGRVSQEMVHKMLLNTRNLRKLTIEKSLDSLPDCLCELKELEEIYIKSNRLKLPDCLGELKNLRAVEYFTEHIDSNIYNAKSLKYLRISSGDTLRRKLGNLSNLEFLSFSGGYINIPKEIEQLKKLKILSLHGPKELDPLVKMFLGEINEELTGKKLVNIDSIPMSGIWLPEEINELTSLMFLGVEGIVVGTFPDISNITNLRVLKIKKTKLQQLPNSFQHFTRLKCTQLEYNKLKQVPSSLFGLDSLVYINLNNNLIPSGYSFDWSGMDGLSEVRLSHNPCCAYRREDRNVKLMAKYLVKNRNDACYQVDTVLRWEIKTGRNWNDYQRFSKPKSY